MFAKFGVFQPPNGAGEGDIDGGRHGVTHRPQDIQVFRVPSLRNVAMTAPYFHDGRAPTLAVAVRHDGAGPVGQGSHPRGDRADRPVPANVDR